MISTDKALLAFTLVFVSSALWLNLPHVSLIIICIAVVFLCIYYSLSASLSGALLGFVWASIMGYWYTSWQLNGDIFNQNVIVEGSVSSVTSFDEYARDQQSVSGGVPAIRVNLTLNKLGTRHLIHSPEVRLSWYRPKLLPKQGQRFRLLINLKVPSGLANPHTFHYQTWLASKNIVATGYVIESISNKLLVDSVSLRQQSIDILDHLQLEHGAWLQALSFGYRGQFSDHDWELLQKSGTAHLFAISGLHVGMVFGYCMLLLSKPIALGTSCLGLKQYRISKISTFFAAITCLFYGYLAGFEVPVLRAILALSLWTYLLLTGSHWRLPAVLLYLLSTFFVLFPFSILGISFWFSFTAVLSIWGFIWRFMPRAKLTFFGKLKYMLYLQIWLCVITMPLTIYTFGHLPIFSLFANLILVPWVSFVLVPLCLLATFMLLTGFPNTFVLFIYRLADSAMSVTIAVMEKTVEVSDKIMIDSINLDASSLFILIMLALVLLLPFWRFKKRLILLCICLVILRTYNSPDSLPTLTIFDVGQGSAALFQFNNSEGHRQAWLFDTGARFPSGFSMAQSVILPMLKHHHTDRLQAAFVSHLDNDHAGGINTLNEELSIERLLTPQHMCNVNSFNKGLLTQANIDVRVLWPLMPKTGEENNHSCVVKLTIGEVSILFAGDIERQAEQALVDMYQQSNLLAADVLIAPHHGSRTSSTAAFVKSVSPKYVVFSAKQPNRWGFPHDDVVARYAKQGSQIFHTGKQGAIEFVFLPEQTKVQTYREDKYNRWYFKAAKSYSKDQQTLVLLDLLQVYFMAYRDLS